MKVIKELTFRTRVGLLLVLFVVALTGLQSVFFFSVLENTVAHQVGSKAVVQASHIASDREIALMLSIRDLSKIKEKFDQLSRYSDADYIVIADASEIRLYHPQDKYIGKKINSGDNHDALIKAKSYVSVRVGESGLSVRGKAPVFDEEHNVIGLVSVGYLVNKLSDRIFEYAIPIVIILAVSFVLSLVGAFYFSNHIKSRMLNMEPEDLAASLQLKKSVMESMYEGILAISSDGRILNVNTQAIDMLGIVKRPEQLIGRFTTEFITPDTFFNPVPSNDKAEENIQDEVISCNGETFIANRVQMKGDGAVIGSVVSLRYRDDIGALTTKLTQAQHYIENLRVLRHEHNNQLSTISGLLQIGETEKALSELEATNSEKQELIDFITRKFRPKAIAGLLLGKYSRAKELGMRLEFDPMSDYGGIHSPLDEDELSAMLGNLLDNAFESSVKNPDSNKVINLLLSDRSDELVIVVSDNGIGLDGEDISDLLKRGVTSKSEPEHGIGLYLVDQYVKRENGTIIVEEAEPRGAVFSIYIPKEADLRA